MRQDRKCEGFSYSVGCDLGTEGTTHLELVCAASNSGRHNSMQLCLCCFPRCAGFVLSVVSHRIAFTANNHLSILLAHCLVIGTTCRDGEHHSRAQPGESPQSNRGCLDESPQRSTRQLRPRQKQRGYPAQPDRSIRSSVQSQGRPCHVCQSITFITGTLSIF